MKSIVSIAGLILMTSQMDAAAPVPFSGQKSTDSAGYFLNIAKNNSEKDDPLKSKTFTKSFSLNSTDRVNINNQYGSIVIKTWDKKEIKVDVDIKAYSNSDSEAQRLLDEVTIDADKRGDQVFYKTQIAEGGRSWGNWVTNGKRVRKEIKVNYTVYMPSGNSLTLAQQYGNIDMLDQSGPLSVKVQYGNFTAGNLSNSNNYVSVEYGKTTIAELNKGIVKHQYGSGVSIGNATDLNVDAQYVQVDINTIKGEGMIKQQYGASLNIGSVGILNLDAQYTKVHIQNIKKGNAIVKQEYGSLEIGSAGSLNLRTEYTGVSIGSLLGDATLNMDYDKLNILKINEGVKSLTIRGEYAGINLGFSDKYGGELEVRTNYASFRYGSGVIVRLAGNNDSSSSEKNYTGKIGGGGSNRVKIRSEYGNITFK